MRLGKGHWLYVIRELAMQESFIDAFDLGAGAAQVPAHSAAIKTGALSFIAGIDTAQFQVRCTPLGRDRIALNDILEIDLR